MGEQGELAAKEHVRYIVTAEKKKDSFESLVMEHLRLSGAYWGLTTLDLLPNSTLLCHAFLRCRGVVGCGGGGSGDHVRGVPGVASGRGLRRTPSHRSEPPRRPISSAPSLCERRSCTASASVTRGLLHNDADLRHPLPAPSSALR